MAHMDDKKAKAQQALDRGGVMLEEFDEHVKVHLAIDPENPHLVFDRLNELEVELVKRAGSDIEKVENAGRFIDDLRTRTRQMLERAGVSVPP